MTSQNNKPRCSATVYGGGFRSPPCSNPGKVERDGKWYCGTHDPVRVEKKRKERDKQWNAEWDKKAARQEENRAKRTEIERRAAAYPDLLEALKAASDHLDYCGYGDSWERECAVASGLEKQIEDALEKAS